MPLASLPPHILNSDIHTGCCSIRRRSGVSPSVTYPAYPTFILRMYTQAKGQTLLGSCRGDDCMFGDVCRRSCTFRVEYPLGDHDWSQRADPEWHRDVLFYRLFSIIFSLQPKSDPGHGAQYLQRNKSLRIELAAYDKCGYPCPAETIIESMLNLLQILLSDAIVVWRAVVIWEHRRVVLATTFALLVATAGNERSTQPHF